VIIKARKAAKLTVKPATKLTAAKKRRNNVIRGRSGKK
jgi:hypothetical protein